MKKIKYIAIASALAVSLAGAGLALAQPANAETTGAAATAKYMRTVETDSAGWTFSGFDLIENDNASRSFEHGTFSAGATAEYRFKSDRLELVGYRGPVGGTLSVEIDGERQAGVSLYAESDGYKATLAAYDLDEGWHTVRIATEDDGKWHALDCVKVALDKEIYEKNYNLALIGDIICSVTEPTGGGNKDLNVIRNEKVYPVGTKAGAMQYDSFHGSGREIFYMGYRFAEQFTFAKLVFQEGDTWEGGGWFADGEIAVQVKTETGWKNVELLKPVGYPDGDTQDAFGESCERYVFEFEPIKGEAIRLYGMTGGAENFVSVAQIEVYGSADAKTLAEGYDYREATIYEATEPDTPPTPPDKPEPDDEPDKEDGDGVDLGLAVGLPVGIVGAAAVAVGVFFLLRKRKTGKNVQSKDAAAPSNDDADGEKNK